MYGLLSSCSSGSYIQNLKAYVSLAKNLDPVKHGKCQLPNAVFCFCWSLDSCASRLKHISHKGKPFYYISMNLQFLRLSFLRSSGQIQVLSSKAVIRSKHHIS